MTQVARSRLNCLTKSRTLHLANHLVFLFWDYTTCKDARAGRLKVAAVR